MDITKRFPRALVQGYLDDVEKLQADMQFVQARAVEPIHVNVDLNLSNALTVLDNKTTASPSITYLPYEEAYGGGYTYVPYQPKPYPLPFPDEDPGKFLDSLNGNGQTFSSPPNVQPEPIDSTPKPRRRRFKLDRESA